MFAAGALDEILLHFIPRTERQVQATGKSGGGGGAGGGVRGCGPPFTPTPMSSFCLPPLLALPASVVLPGRGHDVEKDELHVPV